MSVEDRARAHDQVIASAVSRSEFEKLEGTVTTQGRDLTEVMAMTRSMASDVRSLVQSVEGMRDTQASIQREIAETRAATKPRGLDPGLVLTMLAFMVTCLSVGGMLVYQHVNGTVMPLQRDIAELRESSALHNRDGHPFSIQADIQTLRARFDDSLRRREIEGGLREQLETERLEHLDTKIDDLRAQKLSVP